MKKIGLQLYSIKELTQNDFLGTLKKVKEIGYDGVEFAGYFDTSAKELGKVLNDLDLKAAGSHLGIDALKNSLDAQIEYSLEIKSPYIICPYLPEEMRNSKDAYKRTADLFNQIGQKCKDNGLLFGYHNHDFEFKKFGDDYGMDLLVQYTQPELMFVELDTYWVKYMNIDSVDIINNYKERLKILHIKDMKSMEEKKNTEIGNGIMDFKAIIAAGKQYGTQWFTVEQEAFEIPQLDSIKISYDYMNEIL